MNCIEGFMHLNQRDEVCCRLSRKAFQEGVTSLTAVGEVLARMVKETFSVRGVRVTFYTSEDAIPFIARARGVHEAREKERITGKGKRKEEDAPFYGCVICQDTAPIHLCVITPERPGVCGFPWVDAKRSQELDPRGPVFEIEKGTLLNKEKCEYSGVNEAVQKGSLGENKRVFMHSLFEYPHTSCSLAEAAAFYIEEVDGIGIVSRDYHEDVLGIPFFSLISRIGNGRQHTGYTGMAVEYLRSSSFLRGDGGWERVVWMPHSLKEKVRESIPSHLYGKIATEDITTVKALNEFLRKKNHPVITRRKEVTVEERGPAEELTFDAEELEVIPLGAVKEVKIILKNVRIHADKIIVRRG